MKEIKISEKEEGFHFEIKGFDPFETMQALTATIAMVLDKIKPKIEEKSTIIKPNLRQAMNVDKSKIN